MKKQKQNTSNTNKPNTRSKTKPVAKSSSSSKQLVKIKRQKRVQVKQVKEQKQKYKQKQQLPAKLFVRTRSKDIALNQQQVSISICKKQKKHQQKQKQDIQFQPIQKQSKLKRTKSKNKDIVRTTSKQNLIPSYQIVQVQQGSKLKVKIHKVYQIEAQSWIGKHIKNWVHLLIKKQKIKSQQKNNKVHKLTQYTFYPSFQFCLANEDPQKQKCSICQFQYQPFPTQQSQKQAKMEKQLTQSNENDLIILKCSHIMHYQCITQLLGKKQYIKCPICSSIYGRMLGDQPAGTMSHYANKLSHCQGYPQCGTIIINYNMHAGTRQSISFPGTHRMAYLPDNKQGNQILLLLKEAFDRKLIFTIGRSVTTGRDNQIVWNGIHHKTNTTGGSAYFGYPDPTYFQRVKLELAAKGIY